MIFRIFIAYFAIVFVANASQAQVKIGVVNIQQILNSIKEGKKVTGQLKKSYEEKKKRLKKEEDRIKKAQENFVKQGTFLSAEAKAKKEQKIQQDIMSLRNKTMEYQRDIQQQEANLKKPILERIKGIIDTVSKSSGVDMTIEVSASPVVFAKDKVDLTQKVIQQYDKKHGK
jgi:outer membrane protein